MLRAMMPPGTLTGLATDMSRGTGTSRATARGGRSRGRRTTDRCDDNDSVSRHASRLYCSVLIRRFCFRYLGSVACARAAYFNNGRKSLPCLIRSATQNFLNAESTRFDTKSLKTSTWVVKKLSAERAFKPQDNRRYRERFYLQHYILILAICGR